MSAPPHSIGESVPRDVPVAVQVGGDLGATLTTWLESDLGWQVVTGRGALSPLGIVTDDPSDARGAVVVVDGRLPEHVRAELRRRGLHAGALDVVVWPDERQRLPEAVLIGSELGSAPRGPAVSSAWGARRALRVAGVCGGAGASTVALALGAWAAWSGARVLVVGHDDLLSLCGVAPWTGPGSAEVAALPPVEAGREALGLAHRVPGVDGLRLLGGGGEHVGAIDDWPADVVLVDARTNLDTARLLVSPVSRRLAGVADRRSTVLVRTSDRRGRRAADRLLGGPPAGWIAEDPRVAAAGLGGRVPGSLPGRWLAALSDAVARCAGASR